MTYGPGNVLFLARYPNNEIGQTVLGSTITNKIIPLAPLGITGSPGSLLFVPPGQPGAGSLKIASYSGGQWYDAAVAADGAGTYDIVNVRAIPGAVLSGPEGFIYVNAGSPRFSAASLLVSEYGSGRVSAFEVDADGDPLVATRRDFITGLSGAEGAFVDPVTGDFLFSTYGGGEPGDRRPRLRAAAAAAGRRQEGQRAARERHREGPAARLRARSRCCVPGSSSRSARRSTSRRDG